MCLSTPMNQSQSEKVKIEYDIKFNFIWAEKSQCIQSALNSNRI